MYVNVKQDVEVAKENKNKSETIETAGEWGGLKKYLHLNGVSKR